MVVELAVLGLTVIQVKCDFDTDGDEEGSTSVQDRRQEATKTGDKQQRQATSDKSVERC